MSRKRIMDRVGRPGGPLEASSLWHLQVVDALKITPKMLRVVLTGAKLEMLRFDAGQDLMLRVPGSGAQPVVNRRYTIRSLDRQRRLVTLDGSLHGAGPGTAWMRAAKAGARISAIGPRGNIRLDPQADWHLFLGDETAIPGVFAMLEALPPGASALALLEVDGPDEQQRPDIRDLGDMRIQWLHRRPGEAPGDPDLALEAVAKTKLPPGNGHAYIAGENRVVRAVKSALQDHGLSPPQISAKGYWRKGLPNPAEGEPAGN